MQYAQEVRADADELENVGDERHSECGPDLVVDLRGLAGGFGLLDDADAGVSHATCLTLTSLECHVLAERAGAVLHQGADGGSHVFALEERCGDLVNQCVRGEDTRFSLRSNQALAGGQGTRGACRQSLSKRQSLSPKLIVRHDAVDDIPALEGCGVVLRACVHDLEGSARASPFGEPLRPAEQGCGADRLLYLTESRGLSGYDKVACECDLQTRRQAIALDCADRWERQALEVVDERQGSLRAVALIARALTAEHRHVGAGRKDSPLSAHQKGANAGPGRLLDGRAKVREERAAYEIQRRVVERNDAGIAPSVIRC